MLKNEIYLSEATFEQLVQEISNRTHDFTVIAVSEDGSHGKHSHLWYGSTHGALGLVEFAKGFLMHRMLHGPASQPPPPDSA